IAAYLRNNFFSLKPGNKNYNISLLQNNNLSRVLHYQWQRTCQHADMIQNMNDIAVWGCENPDPLTAIGFNLMQFDLATTRANEQANLLAEANGDKADPNESKIIRNKACTHLKEGVDKIRKAGKYLLFSPGH
ncbi:hypothetical protein, partial [Mariniphaga sediminis]|uniref:hypothetical protein n=1 Tax=Mariniphaga sediminis TaxID=1628158 RepID=UPI003569B5AE